MGEDNGRLEVVAAADLITARGRQCYHDPDIMSRGSCFGSGMLAITRDTTFLVDAAAEHCEHWNNHGAAARLKALSREMRGAPPAHSFVAMIRNAGYEADTVLTASSHLALIAKVAVWCRANWRECCPNEEMPGGPDTVVVDEFFHGHHMTLTWAEIKPEAGP